MHQWLWDLFPGGKERQFLYRREELQGAFRFFVLSQEQPAASAIFDVQTRPFAPMLSAGQTLRFNLRANPTVCKNGKRHDLLMEAKRQRKTQGDSRGYLVLSAASGADVVGAPGEQNGFTLRETSVDAYRQQQIRREKSRQMIQFSSVDYTGVLVLNDPVLFLQRLAQGYGKSRAFGCGMMMIKPGDDA